MTKYSTQSTAATNAVLPQVAEGLKSIFEKHFEQPLVIIEKTKAPTFIPASFRIQSRNDANIDTSTMIVFDVDQKLGMDYADDMIQLEETEDALIDLGLEHFIYTSHSHTLSAPRFRIVISASRPFYPTEHNTICAAILEQLDEFLGGRLLKVIDPCWKVPSQCYYTFTVHPDRQAHAISFFNPGHPADADDYKLHQSRYGIEQEYKPGAPRKATGATGARGRSYELNRIVGGMLTSSTEAEIAKRLFEIDNTLHAPNGYFRDPQYPRNRQRPGETPEAAAWRSCVAFTKSHLNSLKRKIRKPADTAIVFKKSTSREPMPTHDALIQLHAVKDQPTTKGGESVLLELIVLSGEHAGRHFWHRLYGQGNHEMAIKISTSIKDKIARATKTEIKTIQDTTRALGKPVMARIKHKPGTGGFPAQNEIGDLHLN
ncbi:hypothetical protein [Pseudomonas fluorescens]|uniref:Uncharacterized protein n=1 Tax=Pseudomonas fluorescens TaxID=294 RepID=A0A0F4VFG6_PSEFL|nr:hypothetical protein [Pseudomonas fluorescens]KJZ67275.1 hypothetical protein VD17_03180 [Pseudomonas fluorescens]